MLALLLALAAATAQDSLLVSAAWVRANGNRPDVVVVHAAMSRAEYDRGHVPGAYFADAMAVHGEHGDTEPLPVARLVAAVEAAGISNQQRVVLVGSPMNTAIFFLALEYLGHGDRTSVLNGGLAAWQAAGGTVSTASVTPPKARFEPHPRGDMFVTADWIAARLPDSALALLDARSRAEYDGVSDVGGLRRPGHIPGARHLDWLATLEGVPAPSGAAQIDNDDPAARLRPRTELARLFREAGADGGRQVVTYCTVGMRASHLYFAARVLGLRPKIYLGSMADWSPRERLPVVGPRR